MTTSESPISSEEAFDLRKTDSIHLLLQALISFIVMFFCMGQLLAKTSNPALYWGGITSIVAWWMPSPAEATRKRGTIAPNNNSSDLTVHETTSSLPSDQTNAVTTLNDNLSLPAHEKMDTVPTLKSTESTRMNIPLNHPVIPQKTLNWKPLETESNELLNNSLAYRLLCASVVAYGINAWGKLVPSQPYYDAVGFIHPPVAFASGEDDIDACLVGTIDKGVILAFRGTIPPIIKDLQSWLDWINDGMGQPIEVPGFPGKVHEGFWGSLDALWNGLIAEIKRQLQINGKCLPLYITGHSKGGAIASLAAFRLMIAEGITPAAVYTFAAPHPGDITFAKQYQATVPRHIRYEFGDDIVPFLIPDAAFMEAIAAIPDIGNRLKGMSTWNYSPVGQLKYIKWDKTTVVNDSPELKTERLARLMEAIATLRFEEIVQAHSISIGGGYMDGIHPEMVSQKW